MRILLVEDEEYMARGGGALQRADHRKGVGF